MENFNDEFGDLSRYKILSFEETTQGFEGNKNALEGIARRSFEEISYENKIGTQDKCKTTEGKFYSGNMNENSLLNDLSNRSDEKFFFYYQNYELSNPGTIGGISPTVIQSTSTTYVPNKYFQYTIGNESRLALLNIELNERACFINLKNTGSIFHLNPEKKEIEFRLEFVYNDYLDKRVFNTKTGLYNLDKIYNAIIISTSDVNGFVALSEKLGVRNDARNEIITLFAEKVLKTKEPSALKFLYENMPNFVTEEILIKLEQNLGEPITIPKEKTEKVKVENPTHDFLWKHLEILSNHDDKGFFSWTKDSSGALLNLLKIFKNSQFLFESFKSNQTMVKRIFNNMNKTSVIEGREWSNKTLFANFITALCIDNAFEELRILDKEFIIGNDYAISSGGIFQAEKENEFFLQQLKAKTELIKVEGHESSTEYTKVSLKETEDGNLYHPMDIVLVKYADIKKPPFPYVSVMTIKAFAEERDQQLTADAVRIGFDVLAIVLGVVFFPAGGAVGIAAETIGIGLALADIGITANREDIEREPGGKDFLKTWNNIYLVGGLAFASVAMVEQIFAKSVFGYLNALKKNSPLLETYEKSLGKILLQREILTFAGNTLKPSTEISLKILAYNSDKIPKATAFAFGKYERNLLPLYEKGAILVEVGEQEYALVYKGEKLIQGTPNEKKVYDFYKNLKKNQKRLSEFLEELRHEGGAYGESIVATTDAKKIKLFEEGLQQFSKTIVKPFEKMKESMPYFNHKSIGNEVIQIGKSNCGNTAKVIAEYLRTGKLQLAEPSLMQGLEEVAEKCGAGRFSDITGIDRLGFLLRDDEIAIIYGTTNYNLSGSVEGHYFVAVKVDKRVHLLDGQTGEFLLYEKASKESQDFIRGYRQFKYTKAGKIKK